VDVVLTTYVIQALDASRVSANQATVIRAAAARAFGVNVEHSNINRKSIQVKRNQKREEAATKQKKECSTDEVLTLHWDG